MNEEAERIKKKVDENWKAQVEKERMTFKEPSRLASPPPRSDRVSAEGLSGREPSGGEPPDFGFFVSSLSMQVMAALGELPHPVTNQRQEDLPQARTLIDILGMLQEKTKGNLTEEEAEGIEGVLYELRMKYVAKARGAGA